MKCAKCGSELRAGARFCYHCGSQVKISEYEQKRQNRQIALSILLSLLVIVFMAGGVWNTRVQGTALAFQMKEILRNGGTGKNQEKSAKVSNGDNQFDEEDDYEDSYEEDDYEEGDYSGENENEDDSDSEQTDGQEYDMTEGGIHIYQFVVDDCSWNEAFRRAVAAGGHLLRINSREEYEHVISQIQDIGMEKIQFRIGGRRNQGEDAYYWVDTDNQVYGDKLNDPAYWAYEEWMEGEPSFSDGEIEEDCMDFYYFEKEGRWVWNDVPDDIVTLVPYFSGKLGYIVEYE